MADANGVPRPGLAGDAVVWFLHEKVRRSSLNLSDMDVYAELWRLAGFKPGSVKVKSTDVASVVGISDRCVRDCYDRLERKNYVFVSDRLRPGRPIGPGLATIRVNHWREGLDDMQLLRHRGPVLAGVQWGEPCESLAKSEEPGELESFVRSLPINRGGPTPELEENVRSFPIMGTTGSDLQQLAALNARGSAPLGNPDGGQESRVKDLCASKSSGQVVKESSASEPAPIAHALAEELAARAEALDHRLTTTAQHGRIKRDILAAVPELMRRDLVGTSEWVADRLADLVVFGDGDGKVFPEKALDRLLVKFRRRRSKGPIENTAAYFQTCAADAARKEGVQWKPECDRSS